MINSYRNSLKPNNDELLINDNLKIKDKSLRDLIKESK